MILCQSRPPKDPAAAIEKKLATARTSTLYPEPQSFVAGQQGAEAKPRALGPCRDKSKTRTDEITQNAQASKEAILARATQAAHL